MKSRKITRKINILIGTLLLIISGLVVWFIFVVNGSYKPITDQGHRWRIGYYEGGPYKDYQTYLIAVVRGLEHLGWLPEIDWPEFEDNDNTKAVWEFLGKIDSYYIDFVQEAYWTSDWYEHKRRKNKLDAIVYLQQRKLDLIIAGGTWAGLDLANYSHSVPVLVISTSEPIKAGIIVSAEDSGYDHVHAVCDPKRYERQLRAFHNIINFKNLGVVYEDSDDGRVYAALDSVTKMSKELEFNVVGCIANDADLPEEQAMQGVLRCHEELTRKVDAVYITAHRGVNPKWMPGVLKPLFEHKIPTFAQEGPDQVKRGVLLSISRVEVEEMGLFQAEVIAKIFHGVEPREIKQVFEEPKRIVVNTKTAELIDYNLPKSVIDAADRVYETIDEF